MPPVACRLPARYLLVENPGAITVEYLLLYCDDSSHNARRWYGQHVCMWITVVYAALMILIPTYQALFGKNSLTVKLDT